MRIQEILFSLKNLILYSKYFLLHLLKAEEI
jgi:hypothetical protein